ncbi:MAG: hypothetical protein JSV74_04370 [Dehalococcoidia bacterium]|nr:MAG: hypothetical protein JSV74_04370 [Dehalococcoidia bacterium]
MRISRTGWLLIGVVIFIICAIVLYMFYQNQTNARQEAQDELEVAQDTALMLLSQKGAMEVQIAEKETELVQWEDTLNQLEEQLTQSEADLNSIQQEIPFSAESIEYDEILFSYALENEIELFSISTSEIGEADIEEVNYGTVTYGMNIRGDVENILDFVNTVVNSNEFKTATLAPVNLTIPDPLDDEEIDNLEQSLREGLTAEALAKISTGDIISFTFESVIDVFGSQYIDQLTNDTDGTLETNTVAEMAEIIKERISDSIYLESEFEELLAVALAENIEQGLADSVVGVVISSVTQKIDELVITRIVIEGGEEGEQEIIVDQEALIELVGSDLAMLIGEQIGGLATSPIGSILTSYVADTIEEKMLNAVVDSVEKEIEDRMPIIIEEAEMPSASMTIVVYIYQSGGN